MSKLKEKFHQVADHMTSPQKDPRTVFGKGYRLLDDLIWHGIERTTQKAEKDGVSREQLMIGLTTAANLGFAYTFANGITVDSKSAALYTATVAGWCYVGRSGSWLAIPGGFLNLFALGPFTKNHWACGHIAFIAPINLGIESRTLAAKKKIDAEQTDSAESGINAVLKRMRLPLLAAGTAAVLLFENGIGIATGIEAIFLGICAYLASTSNGMLQRTKDWMNRLFKKPAVVPECVPIKCD